ncbi:DUF6879 family protein [Yinghuangia seranimata]|uniref:DUF6879 family protein n=1 Tax=Yinghuangia seranimata TaxID=408067 RepID=UPI00248CE38F|nr:DUF6879 family protein [Yinghuangia seranimata]MDI2129905.1 hypothetical protein [Yinghuangia seranimata]
MPGRWWRSAVVRKVLGTLALGALAVGLGLATDLPLVGAVLLSCFVSGVALVVQVLVEVEHRLERVERAHDRQTAEVTARVADTFRQANDATRLVAQIDACPVGGELTRGFVRNAARIDADTPPLVQDLARASVDRTSTFLKELREGEAKYEGEDTEWLMSLARSARHSIDATTSTGLQGPGGDVVSGFWPSDRGKRYLRAQHQAVRDRGVRIRRIFVLERPGLAADPAFAEVVREQTDIGIEVRVLSARSIPPALSASWFDFVLVDDTVSYESVLGAAIGTAGSPSIIETVLVLRPDRVRERAVRFAELWEAAEPFTEPFRDAFTRPVS